MKNNLIKIAALLLLSIGTLTYADTSVYTSNSDQMILVTAKDWDSNTGTLQRFERSGDTTTRSGWKKVGEQVIAMLGKNGMAWGAGLHTTPTETKDPIITKEGLRRSPVGIFTIPLAFGKDQANNWSVKMPYQQISDTIFCGGDQQSKNYNRIVDIRSELPEDWSQGENMQDYVNQGVYTYGAVIGHNYQQTIPGLGSCFFIHVWRGLGKPTAGCTAVEENNAKEIISWLDPEKKPILVQLPETMYAEVQKQWDLPDLTTPTVHDDL